MDAWPEDLDRSLYDDVPAEVHAAADEEYGRVYIHELDHPSRQDRISEIDADAHLEGLAAGAEIYRAWFEAQSTANREIAHVPTSLPEGHISLIADINEEALRYLAKHPALLYQISSRKFEEVIATLLRDFGFEVDLTQATRDGGVDIYAYLRTKIGSFLTLVECKHYRPENFVGVGVVRELYGGCSVPSEPTRVSLSHHRISPGRQRNFAGSQ